MPGPHAAGGRDVAVALVAVLATAALPIAAIAVAAAGTLRHGLARVPAGPQS